MRLPTFPSDSFLLLMLLTIVLLAISVHCGPGTFYYRKPTKLVFYKKYPPVLIYPKKVDYQEDDHHHLHLQHALPHTVQDRELVKYGKYFELNPNLLEYLLDYEKRIFSGGERDEHIHFNAGNKFNEPVFGSYYYPRKYLNRHTNSDIKPVVEHIEDDLKYDFRTKTHSYER